MGQVLHIFRKDVRHLWPRALAVLLLMAAHAFIDVRLFPIGVPEMERIRAIAGPVNILLIVTIWFLIAWVILEEALPGDRQFWLARPYDWRKLLAAKVLFVLVFINAPLFLSDCYILAAQGFRVLGVLPGLLLRQVFVTIVSVLPSFVIAVLSAGLSQFLLGWFILALSLIGETMLVSIWYHTSGVAIGVENPVLIGGLVVIACAVVVWQYVGRRTNAGRVIFLGVVCGFLPVMSGAAMISGLIRRGVEKPVLPDKVDIGISYDLGRNLTFETSWQGSPGGFAFVKIPITVTGLPEKTLLRGSANVSINVGGRPWPQPGTFVVGAIEQIRNEYWQTLNVQESSAKLLRQQFADVRSRFDLEIVSDEVGTRVPLHVRSFSLAGRRACHSFSSDLMLQLVCRAGLEPTQETAVRLDSPEGQGQIAGVLMERSIPWGLSPVSDDVVGRFSDVKPESEFAFIPRRSLVKFQRTLDLRNIQLSKYMLPH